MWQLTGCVQLMDMFYLSHAEGCLEKFPGENMNRLVPRASCLTFCTPSLPAWSLQAFGTPGHYTA